MSLSGRCMLEFVGTYFLALVIATAAVGGMAMNLAPIAIGGILIAMIYMAGPHTGAHFNPAITIAFWIRGVFPAAEVVPYILVQCIAGVLAALTQLVLIESAADLVSPDMAALGAIASAAMGEDGGRIADWLQLGIAEFIFTFGLAMVILHVASAKEQAGNQYFALAIGLVVMAGAFAVGPISGAVFNPAVLVSLWVLDAVGWMHGYVILLTTFAGGLLAALTFRAVHRIEADPA